MPFSDWVDNDPIEQGASPEDSEIISSYEVVDKDCDRSLEIRCLHPGTCVMSGAHFTAECISAEEWEFF